MLQDITALEERRQERMNQQPSSNLGTTLQCRVSATRTTELVTFLCLPLPQMCQSQVCRLLQLLKICASMLPLVQCDGLSG